MEQERLRLIEDRLYGIERQLAYFDARLKRLEPAPAPPPRVEAVPPMTPPPAPPVAPTPMSPIRLPQMPSAYTPTPQRDTEYLIGAKLLPKLGAALVLLGVLFFVAWGYSAGWITPAMVFSGELLFCLAFIGVGQWKRNEREDYGQLLTGIGSCGLYMTLAGGHLAHHLYSGETLVGATMLLSLVNLGYALWSSSRTFLGIGMIGGFAAALLPMDRGQALLSAELHMAILLPAALIAMRKRWMEMSIWLWTFSTLALGPVLASSISWELRVGALYVSTAASLAAYLWSFRKTAFDPHGGFMWLAAVAAGLLGLALQNARIGAVHELILGAGLAGAGFLCRDKEMRANAFAAAVALPAVLAPMCFPASECVLIYAGLTVLFAALSLVVRRAAMLCGVELAMSVAAYAVVQGSFPMAPGRESCVLGGMLLAVVATALAAGRAGKNAQVATLAAFAISAPILGRLGVTVLTGSSLAPAAEVAATEGLVLLTFFLIFAAYWTRWKSAVIGLWVAIGLTIVAYINAASSVAPAAGYDAGLLIALLAAVTCAAPVLTNSAEEDFRKSFGALASVTGGLLVMRLAYVGAPLAHLDLQPVVASVLSGTIYGAACCAWSRMRESDPALGGAWAAFVASSAMYMFGTLSAGARGEMSMISAVTALFVLASAASHKWTKREPALWHALAFCGWLLFSRWIDVGITWSGTDLRVISSLTVAWILYAMLLLSVGFWLKVRELRYWSFAVMFTTVAKILLVDLAYTTVPFRVAVLLGLGVLMLAGGYVYIRGRQAQPQ